MILNTTRGTWRWKAHYMRMTRDNCLFQCLSLAVSSLPLNLKWGTGRRSGYNITKQYPVIHSWNHCDLAVLGQQSSYIGNSNYRHELVFSTLQWTGKRCVPNCYLFLAALLAIPCTALVTYIFRVNWCTDGNQIFIGQQLKPWRHQLWQTSKAFVSKHWMLNLYY